jgi:hypothetical protein
VTVIDRLIIDRAIADLLTAPVDLAHRALPRTYRPTHSDRAAVVATAILQIIETAPAGQCRQCIESYLRDELANIEPAPAPDFAD